MSQGRKPFGPHLWDIAAAREALALSAVIAAAVLAFRLSVVFKPIFLAYLASVLA